MTNTQTTAQTLAAGLDQAEQVLVSLRDQRAGIIARIVAGELPPAALDDHDEQIARAIADAERRREIATAADAEAKRQQREALRQKALNAIASKIEAHGIVDQFCQQHHAAYIKAINEAEASLNDLRSEQAKRSGLAQGVEEMCRQFKEQWPDDKQPECPPLSKARIGDLARLRLERTSQSIYSFANEILLDPTQVSA